MQNISLQLDSSGIHSTLNNTLTSLVEQITLELPHTSFVTDLVSLSPFLIKVADKIIPALEDK